MANKTKAHGQTDPIVKPNNTQQAKPLTDPIVKPPNNSSQAKTQTDPIVKP
jgi:hypothetical protein